jgi:hypothetical protein
LVCADGTEDVSCAPCHLVRHLERNTIAEEAVLIWLPEMTQPALNKLATAAHRRLADAGALYLAANPHAGPHQDVLRAQSRRSGLSRSGASMPKRDSARLHHGCLRRRSCGPSQNSTKTARACSGA